MTDATTRTCRDCGETKPIAAYELQVSGKPRWTCRCCRAARRAEATHQAMLDKREREAALGDDIWSAMWTGRSRRALSAVQPRRAHGHRLKLRDGSGYISIAEIACRVAERNAVHRASKACKTHEEAQAAIRVLERDTQGRDRSREMTALARAATGHRNSPALPEEAETPEQDPFADAFGDWAPAWMLADGP